MWSNPHSFRVPLDSLFSIAGNGDVVLNKGAHFPHYASTVEKKHRESQLHCIAITDMNIR